MSVEIMWIYQAMCTHNALHINNTKYQQKVICDIFVHLLPLVVVVVVVFYELRQLKVNSHTQLTTSIYFNQSVQNL